MYLERFIASLDLLRKPEFLDPGLYESFMQEEVFCYGYAPSKEEDGSLRCFLHYCPFGAPLRQLRLEITKPWKYKIRLDEESIDLENAIGAEALRRLFFEAFRLYDGLSYASKRFHVLDLQEPGSLDILLAISQKEDCEGELMDIFHNNLFMRDLYYSQLRYFVKRYIKYSPLYEESKARLDTEAAFDEAFSSVLSEYHANFSGIRRLTQDITGFANPELDDLMDQLVYSQM